MYIFQPAEKLVQEKLMVLRSKIIICFNHLMEVRFHELKHNIDILKLSPRRRKHDVLNFYNVRMFEQSEEFDFSKDSHGIRHMLKNIIYFLYSNMFSSTSVNGRSHNAITSFTNHFLHLISARLSIFREKFCFGLFHRQKHHPHTINPYLNYTLVKVNIKKKYKGVIHQCQSIINMIYWIPTSYIIS